MDRRSLIGALLALVLAKATGAEVRLSRPARVGYIGTGTPENSSHFLQALKDGMAKQGYLEGQNVSYVVRWAMGDPSRMANLAREMVDLKPNVIVAPNMTGT